MAAITLNEAKAYLRVQTSDEDGLISALLASGQAAIDAWLGRPVYASTRTMSLGPIMGSGEFSPRILFSPIYPIEEITSFTDADGVAVDQTELRIDKRSGTFVYKSGQTWPAAPYTLAASVGLEFYPEFESHIEPATRHALLDVVSDLYQRRNPAAMSEREGGGIAVQYSDQIRGIGADNKREDLITPRVAALLAPWRLLGTA